MKIKTNEICLYGLLGTFLFVLKFAMSLLPNVEPVSLLLIAYTIVFGMKAIYPLAVYVFLELIIYGFGFWSVGYLYIWLTLVVIIVIIYKITNSQNPFLWAIISGVFGLIFGALYIPLYIISGGLVFAITWWISGLTFDFIHCISNFVLCAILLKPIINVLSKVKIKDKFYEVNYGRKKI